MAKLVLFHSALGLRPAVDDAADRLRAAGHQVHLAEYFDGETFSTVDAGVAKRDAVGRPELMRRWQAAVQGLPPDLVYAGMSLGTIPAALFAGTRPGARGAILMHGAPDVATMGISQWSAKVPVQLHRAERDPWVEPAEVEALRASVERGGAPFEDHVYPGDVHLFDDPGIEGHDPVSAAVLWGRVLEFLRRIDGR